MSKDDSDQSFIPYALGSPKMKTMTRERVQAQIKSETHEYLQKMADARGISLSAMAGMLLQEAVDRDIASSENQRAAESKVDLLIELVQKQLKLEA